MIGPNGAVKATMMVVITGKTRPDSGTARFGRRLEMLELPGSADGGDYWQGIDLLKMSEPEIAKAGIGRKFQKPTVFEQLTVFENLELALAGDRSFLRTLLARMTAEQQKRIDEVLK